MDRATRQAAVWATAVALPLAVLVAAFLSSRLGPASPPRAGPAVTPVPATAPATVAAPPLSARAAIVCRALVSRLPAALRSLPQRPVTAGPEQNAAYGEPPVLVQCGVAPATYPPTDEVWTLDRVCWHKADTAGATVWTTVDRDVPVRVTLPAAYDPPAQWTIVFSAPVAEAIPRLPAPPPGCA